MHEKVIRAEAKQAGAEMYLASFPLVRHTGPLPPRCTRQSSRRSDQSQSRRGARETVLGKSLGKINTLQDLRQATPLISTSGRCQPRRVSPERWQGLWARGQSAARAAEVGVRAFCRHCSPIYPAAQLGPTLPNSGCLPPTPRVPSGGRPSLGVGGVGKGHTEQADIAKFREPRKLPEPQEITTSVYAGKARSWALRRAEPAAAGLDRPCHPTVPCGRRTDHTCGSLHRRLLLPLATSDLRAQARQLFRTGAGGILCSHPTRARPEQGMWAASGHSLTPETRRPRWVRMGHTSFDVGSFKRPRSF